MFNYFRIMNSPSATALSTNFNNVLIFNPNTPSRDFDNNDDDQVILTVSKTDGTIATSSTSSPKRKSNDKTKDLKRVKEPIAHEMKSIYRKD